MRASRTLALRRETLTQLTASDLNGVAAAGTEPTGGDRCRTLLTPLELCAPTTTWAAAECLPTGRTCPCAGA